MLKYIIKDIYGNETVFRKPLKVNFVSSEDAPADSLTAVFSADGTIYPLLSIEVLDNNDRIFFGYIDTQSDEQTISGIFLTVTARSIAGILLDNEALPQTYSMVSMNDLMKRHFEPFGFQHFKGTRKTFDDEFIITKGMSEWAVLANFCKKFTGTVPKIDCYGNIDISENKDNDCIYISSNQCISKKHTLKRHILISMIMERAAVSDGYVMPFEDELAKSLKVNKKRYINTVDNKNLSPMSARNILDNADNKYEQVILEISGCIICRVGDELIIDNEDKKYIIKEIHYSLGVEGEKTRVYAEVKYI